MKFEDIITTVYADEFRKGQFSLADNGKGVVISSWDVPDTVKPSHEEVMKLVGPDIERKFAIDKSKAIYMESLSEHINQVAQKKQYKNANSCISYLNSSIEGWRNDAIAFLAWRDSIYTYAFGIFNNAYDGIEELPSLEDFIKMAPQISWPGEQ